MANLYIIFDKKPEGKGYTKAFTNRRGLSEFTEIAYSTLTNHFGRNDNVWYDYPEKGIMIIKVVGLDKGKQKYKGLKKGLGFSDRNI